MGRLKRGGVRVAVAVAAGLALLGGMAGCESDRAAENLSPSQETPPVTPDWDELYQATVESLAEDLRQLGVEVPEDVDFVRFIEIEEFGRVQSQCVRDQGFKAYETFDGGVHYEQVPSEQRAAQLQASYRCSVMFPTHPRYFLPMSESQIRVYYDYFVDDLAPCLTAEGYEIPPAPTWEVFLEHFDTGNGWRPYDAVAGLPLGPDEWEQLNRTCPQEPPVEAVYGR